ncbi:MAG: ArsB/NhaD family transporter [Ktedonobacterales bacterium]
MQSILAAVLLVAVLALVIWRPSGLAVAWPAAVGALLALALGLLSFGALRAIFGDTWDAAVTLVALFVLSEALESNGFFTWAALWLAQVARGSGWRLYALALLLTTLVTALLANDGAILMLTPIFATLLLRIYPDGASRLPFLLATGFFADAMSGLFVPSNLTNIIIADANNLAFARVVLWTAIPTVAAFCAAGLAFGFRFRDRLRKPYDQTQLAAPDTAIRDHFVFVCGWVGLFLLVIGYIVGGALHLPVSIIAGSVAVAMLTLVRLRGLRGVGETLAAAPWSILIYALGMFVVITAAFDAHTLAFLTHPLRAHVTPAAGPLGALLSGGILALLSAAVNNLPATLIGVLALREASHVGSMAIYAIILGVDIGPKLTPFGSLATLLWLGILARYGIHISWGRYVKENWWVALLTLGAAFLGLLASNALLG